MGNPFTKLFPISTEIAQNNESQEATIGNASGVSIVTYNILADVYSSYISGANSYDLNYKNRKGLLFKEIANSRADFVCLQELDHYESDFKQFFQSINYESAFIKRPSDYNPDGSMIAWKPKLYDLIESVSLSYNDHPKCKENSTYRKNNIGILLVFRSKINSKCIIIGTSHFYWDPQVEYVKFLQATIYSTAAANLKAKYNCPVILTGDLNSVPTSSVMNYLLNRDLNLSPGNMMDNEISTLIIPNPLNLKSAYENYCETGYPEFTNYTRSFKGTIDHILYSEELTVAKLGRLPSANDLRNVVTLPNKDYPSDHLLLSTQFNFD